MLKLTLIFFEVYSHLGATFSFTMFVNMTSELERLNLNLDLGNSSLTKKKKRILIQNPLTSPFQTFQLHLMLHKDLALI